MKTILFIATLLAPLASLSAEVVASGKFTRIFAAAPAPPIRTAAENLRGFLISRTDGTEVGIVTEATPTAASSPGAILIGTTADTPLLAGLATEGRLGITASESAGDAYEITMIDGCVVVNGANPRAVLYGVFELEDIIAEHGGVPADLALKANPSLGLRLLHPRVRGGFGNYRQSDFEFLARSGGNVAHLAHDWMTEKTLFSFVPSGKFPKAVDADVVERNRTWLRQYLEWCKLYGLDGAMWLCEMPCQGGPWVPEADRAAFLDRYPAEFLSDTGTYQGKVLCLAHPQVEQEYRRMVRQFLSDFPGLSMFLVFTLDSSGELCDPETCSRHHGVSKHTQYNRLLALMAEEGRKVRADFQVFSVGWGWELRKESDYFDQQAALPAGAGLTMPPDGEAWSFDRKTTDLLRQSRDLTRKHGQTFLGYDIFLWGDDTMFEANKPGLSTTALFDFPLGVAAKLRRWQGLGADGFFDQWGTMAEYIQCNAVAMRELVFHPENTAPDRLEQWAQSLAVRRFGAAAAPHVLAAWKEIEAAQKIQSDHTYYWHHLRPSWAGPTLHCPLTLEALQEAKLVGGEPAKPDGSRDYAPYRDDTARAKALAPALRKAADHYSAAIVHLQAALPLVSDETGSLLDHWYRPEPDSPGRFTPLRLLEEQIVSVRLHVYVQNRMSRFFQAWALVKELPATGTAEHESAMKTLEQLRLEDEAGL